MQRYLLFFYALFAYLAAMVSLTILILWVYPWPFMPISVDTGESSSYAFFVDIGLIALFGLQHSVMARPAVKAALFDGRSVSFRASTYTLLSAVCLFVMYLFWQPMTTTVWSMPSGPGYWIMTALYAGGWLLAFIATFQIDHFELFGLHQGWRVLRNLPEPEPLFQKKGFYRFVRHPVQTGTMLGLWATPVMSSGHLLLSIGMSVYILIGLKLEERDLVRALGEGYRRYLREVPMLFPFRKKP